MRTRAEILEELLVLQARAGSARAFEVIYERWHPKLLRRARRLTKDSEAALEAVQEAWIGIARGLWKLEDPMRFGAWALRIVSNKCADWIRKQRAERRLKTRVGNEAGGAARPDARMDDQTSSSDIEALRLAIRLLTEESRLVLTLFYLEEIPVREISRTLGIAEGTVKSRLFHARKQLKKILED